MTYVSARYHGPPAVHIIHSALMAFPVACFALTVITDIAYWRTLNLLWLHFSEWLLFAGILFGILAAIARLVDFIARKARPSWLAIGAGIFILLLATLNSFVHTADGITAVVPFGIALSIVTVLAMIVTGWLGRTEVRHV